MRIHKINKKILEYPKEHPARKFLEAFIECRQLCVGRELPPPLDLGIDQEWFSIIDNKTWCFSSFAYSYISFDLELDGWISDSPKLTESEQSALERIPNMKLLLIECREAALNDANRNVVEMTEVVLEMLILWVNCIKARIQEIA